MLRNLAFVTASLAFLLTGLPAVLEASPCSISGYRVGAAQDDITGEVAERGMLGYANTKQVSAGLHMRLRSRSLVVSNGCGGETLAMTIADVGLMFHAVKQAVIERLAQKLPGVFDHRNLLVSATHTHSGPGGFAHHALYNVTTLGFSPAQFEATVSGIVRSIEKAYRQQEAAELWISRGELDGIQFNRSRAAYEANPVGEKAAFPGDTDPEMIQIKATSADGRPLASFNWFAVHGVSLPMTNQLVSGDNKGLAAYLFEKKMGASYLAEGEFVAGFVQAHSGDVSPYDVSQPVPENVDGFLRNEASARAQFQKAFELFNDAHEELAGPLAAVHTFQDLAYRKVDARFTQAGPQRTCNAALGTSFAAGTENGRPVDLFEEGRVFGVNWPKITLMPEEQACHGEKVILLPTGFVKPHPWTARIAPFQLLRIGQLAIVAVPFEITTMAGRRLKREILDILAPTGVTYVAISALANEYLHYVTTREEYGVQHYEGGSTLYGPWSLAAHTEILADLAKALRDGVSPPRGPLPPDLTNVKRVVKPGVILDSVPLGKRFGALKKAARSTYRPGERVDVEFWGAHPNNSMNGRDASLLTVQRREGTSWKPWRYDWDPDTFYRWRRVAIAQSSVEVSWLTDVQTPPGRYRICHQGHAKAMGGKLSAYRGCSASFLVQEEP